MMKLYYLLFLSFFFVANGLAEPITKSDARQIANQFLQKQGKSVKGEPARAPRVTGVPTLKQDVAAYYVFNTSDNDGFVIVSGDDEIDEILGYSMNGAFSESDMPDNMKAWLQGYADQLKAIAAGKGVAARAATHASSIAQKMTTKWDQDAPFNKYCYFNSTLCHTGCVATAIAQVMKWNQWPASTTVTIPGYTSETSGYQVDALSPVTFVWGNMLDEYSYDTHGNCTNSEAQQNAVALLMRAVGQGVTMNYTSGNSGSNYGKGVNALVKYFNYANCAAYENAASYSVEEWDNLIYNELQQRPVLYDGQSTGGGHAFVIDGYDSASGTYYVNWGWGGHYDGFYRLRIMDAQGGGVGSSSSSDGYALDQGAIINLIPNNGSQSSFERYLRGCGNLGTRTQEGTFYLTCGFHNPYSEAITFDRTMARVDESGAILSVVTPGSPSSVEAKGKRMTSGFPIANLKLSNLGPGTYRYVPVSREQNKTTWHKMYSDNKYFEIVYRSNNDYDIILHPVQSLSGVGAEITGPMSASQVHKFNVELNNEAEDFSGLVYVFVKKPGSETFEHLGGMGLAIAEGASETANYSFIPESPGSYILRMTADEAGTQILGEASAEIGGGPIEYVSSVFTNNGGAQNLSLTLRNNTTNNYRTAIFAYLYKQDGTSWTYNSYAYNSSNWNALTANTEATISMNVGSLAQGEYKAELMFASDFQSTNTADFVKFYDLYFTIDEYGNAVVGIDQIETDGEIANTEDYYTIGGMRLMGKPSKKGIYIYKGKKVVM